MAKDPAFLFYPNDWLGGTMAFSRHEKGCYIDLLMCQFNEGHMELHMVRTILGENDYELYWDKKIKKKFKVDSEGKFYNEKLDNEVIKRKNYTESRRKNLSHKNTDMFSHMDEHMENGNNNIYSLNGRKNGNKQFVNPKAIGHELYANRIKSAEAELNRAKDSEQQEGGVVN